MIILTTSFSVISSAQCGAGSTPQLCCPWGERDPCLLICPATFLNSQLIVLTPVQVIRAVMINEIPCEKGRISSIDNIKYRYDRRGFFVQPYLHPSPAGLYRSLFIRKMGVVVKGKTQTGIKQSEIGWVFKKRNFGKKGQIFRQSCGWPEAKILRSSLSDSKKNITKKRDNLHRWNFVSFPLVFVQVCPVLETVKRLWSCHKMVFFLAQKSCHVILFKGLEHVSFCHVRSILK